MCPMCCHKRCICLTCRCRRLVEHHSAAAGVGGGRWAVGWCRRASSGGGSSRRAELHAMRKNWGWGLKNVYNLLMFFETCSMLFCLTVYITICFNVISMMIGLLSQMPLASRGNAVILRCCAGLSIFSPAGIFILSEISHLL